MRIAALFCSFFAGCALAADVRVCGYVFPPFLDQDHHGYFGLTMDLIDELNAAQAAYVFRFVPTTPMDRYADFAAGTCDAFFFEDRAWGWQEHAVESSRPYLSGGEVYIAKAQPGRDQTFFGDLKGKRIVGYEGYHYRLANYVTDPDVLQRDYNMTVTTSHWNNIRSVILGEYDVAIVTRSYLLQFLLRNRENRSKLLVSDKLDQEYQHTVLVRKGGVLTAAEMNRLLDALQDAGKLDSLWWRYGIASGGETP